MSWAIHHTEPFTLEPGDVGDQVRRALIVTQGAPPQDVVDTAVQAATTLLPVVAHVGDRCYVTVTGHDGDINSLTVSVSANTTE